MDEASEQPFASLSSSVGVSASGTSAPRDKPVLLCSVESVRLFVTLLSCLSTGRKDQRVQCDVDAEGIVFTYHSRGKSLQLKSSLTSSLFDSYDFDVANEEENDVTFALNLHLLLECMSIFGMSALSTTAMRLSYAPEEARLFLVVEHSGILCECAIQVLEHEGNDMSSMEFENSFENSPVVGRCIIQSEPFGEAIAEIYDLPSAAAVAISMHGAQEREHQSTCLSLRATSEMGTCEVAFTDSSSAFVEFACASSGCTGTFHVAVLQQAFKALVHATETFLRMNEDGFLSVQHMLEASNGEKAFVDALVSPEELAL